MDNEKETDKKEVKDDFVRRFQEWDIEEDLWNQSEFPRPSKESIAKRNKIREEQLKEEKRRERLLRKKSIYDDDSDFEEYEQQLAAAEIAADLAAVAKEVADKKAAADALLAAYIDPCTIGCPPGYKKVRGRLLKIYVPEIKPGDEEARKQEQRLQEERWRETQMQIREVSGLGFSNELIEARIKAKQKMGPKPYSPPNGLTPDLSFKTKAELEAMGKVETITPSSSSNSSSSGSYNRMQVGSPRRPRIRSLEWPRTGRSNYNFQQHRPPHFQNDINRGTMRRDPSISRGKRLKDDEFYSDAE